jgi:hypothetical protein
VALAAPASAGDEQLLRFGGRVDRRSRSIGDGGRSDAAVLLRGDRFRPRRRRLTRDQQEDGDNTRYLS